MIEKELRYHTLYMDIAKRVALMSYAVRSKVGAILVKDGAILGMGFNGMPAGMTNVCEYEDYTDSSLKITVTKPEVLHAEENLFMKMLKAGINPIDSTLYVTLAPCMHCAKLIYGAGTKNVFFHEAYRTDNGIDFLYRMGINVSKIDE